MSDVFEPKPRPNRAWISLGALLAVAVIAVGANVLADRFLARARIDLTELQDSRLWSVDRLHLNALGHHAVARMVLDTLRVPHGLQPRTPEPRPQVTWREAKREDMVWAREYFVPWVVRRIRRVSSGDLVAAKRPDFADAAATRADDGISAPGS